MLPVARQNSQIDRIDLAIVVEVALAEDLAALHPVGRENGKIIEINRAVAIGIAVQEEEIERARPAEHRMVVAIRQHAIRIRPRFQQRGHERIVPIGARERQRRHPIPIRHLHIGARALVASRPASEWSKILPQLHFSQGESAADFAIARATFLRTCFDPETPCLLLTFLPQDSGRTWLVRLTDLELGDQHLTAKEMMSLIQQKGVVAPETDEVSFEGEPGDFLERVAKARLNSKTWLQVRTSAKLISILGGRK